MSLHYLPPPPPRLRRHFLPALVLLLGLGVAASTVHQLVSSPRPLSTGNQTADTLLGSAPLLIRILLSPTSLELR